MDMPPGVMETAPGRGGGGCAGEWKRWVVRQLSHDTCTNLGHWCHGDERSTSSYTEEFFHSSPVSRDNCCNVPLFGRLEGPQSCFCMSEPNQYKSYSCYMSVYMSHQPSINFHFFHYMKITCKHHALFLFLSYFDHHHMVIKT